MKASRASDHESVAEGANGQRGPRQGPGLLPSRGLPLFESLAAFQRRDHRKAPLLSSASLVKDLLAGMVKELDAFQELLESVEVKRRLPVATRLRLQADALARRFEAARIVVDVGRGLQQITPAETYVKTIETAFETWLQEFNQLLTEEAPAVKEKLLARIRERCLTTPTG